MGSNVSHAQQNDETRTITLRHLVITHHPGFKKLHLHDPAGKPEQAGIPITVKKYLNHERSVVRLAGNKLIYTKASTRTGAESETVAAVNIPLSLDKALLLFLPTSEGSSHPFRIVVINDSVKFFPRGAYSCYNLSSLPMRLKLGKDTFSIEASKHKIVSKFSVNSANHVEMFTFVKYSNKWSRAASGLWPHPGQKRVYQFFYRDAKSGRMVQKGIKDVSPE